MLRECMATQPLTVYVLLAVLHFSNDTPFLLFSLDFVLLKLLGKLFFLLFFHVTMQVFGSVAQGRGHQDLSVLTQLISDPDEELLQLHSIFKDLRVCPVMNVWLQLCCCFVLNYNDH